jgi:hypothetical protein
MSDPAVIDIIADRRVPFNAAYAFLDVNWTGATFAMQVRAVKDTATTAIFTSILGTVTIPFAGTAAVSAHIAAGRLSSEIYDLVNPATGAKYQSTDSVLLTQLGISIAAATLSSFPLAEEVGDDWQGWYDLIVEPSGGTNQLIMGGKFTVRAGVTIP